MEPPRACDQRMRVQTESLPWGAWPCSKAAHVVDALVPMLPGRLERACQALPCWQVLPKNLWDWTPCPLPRASNWLCKLLNLQQL